MLVYDGSYKPISVMEYEADDGEGGRRWWSAGKGAAVKLPVEVKVQIFETDRLKIKKGEE